MRALGRREFALLALAALGCAHGAAAADKPWRVLDSFEVGANVYVRALAVEAARGAIWVGTSAGVHEIDLATLKPRQTFTRKDGLANEYVFAVGIDRQGYKWFGTNAGGASRYKDGQWKTFFPMHGLADSRVYAFASQRDGTWWIGTWAGASRVDARSGAFSNYVKQLVNEWVYGIGVDAQDASGSAPRAASRCSTAGRGEAGRTPTGSARRTTRRCRSAPTPASARARATI